jgi:hypothetical protein
MRVIFIFLLLFIINFSSGFAQVEIKLKNGEKFPGIIDSSNNEYVFLHKPQDNTILKIDKSNIKETKQLYTIITNIRGKEFEGELIHFSDSSAILNTQENNEIRFQRNEIQSLELSSNYNVEGYQMLGVSFLTPGGINLIYGNQFREIGFRLTVGLFPKSYANLWGLQGNFLYNIKKTRTFETNFSVAVGYMNYPGWSQEEIHYSVNANNWTYFAVCYDLNTYGFFFEIGLSVGMGTFKNPSLLMQLGYVYRFIY